MDIVVDALQAMVPVLLVGLLRDGVGGDQPDSARAPATASLRGTTDHDMTSDRPCFLDKAHARGVC